ncbi:hypothetical protein T09_9699 [Trichinella sp. T9]|nr:hypothetical protein T09_9699 [Trichinella sp. T9]
MIKRIAFDKCSRVLVSRHITCVGKGDFDTMEKSTRISLQQNICDIELPSFLYDRCALSAFALTLCRHAFAAIVLRALQLHTSRDSLPASENDLI